jgi:hypothetical protein
VLALRMRTRSLHSRAATIMQRCSYDQALQLNSSRVSRVPVFPPQYPMGRADLIKLATIIGLVLVIASPALAIGQWYSNRSPLRTLAWVEQHRSPGDSALYASALYHAGHAQASNTARWHLSGYATLGVIGTLLGLGLLVAARSRRTA